MVTKKTDPKKAVANVAGKASLEAQKKVAEATEKGKQTLENVGSTVTNLEKKIMALPVDRRTVFFCGLAIIVFSFLGNMGTVLLILLGILMMYLSLTKKSVADLLNLETPKKK